MYTESDFFWGALITAHVLFLVIPGLSVWLTDIYHDRSAFKHATVIFHWRPGDTESWRERKAG